MGWTAPALGSEFAVSEVVTATKMNSKLADNLRYLKGLDGAVQIDSTLTLPAGLNIGTAAGASGGSLPNLHIARAGQAGFDLQNTTTGGTPSAGARWRLFADNVGGGAGNCTFGFYDVSNTRVAMAIDDNGRFAVGTTSPAGPIHVVGRSVGRWAMYDFSALAGTTVVIVPDGAGDVTVGLVLVSIVKASNSAIPQAANAFGTVIQPGGNTAIYTDGGTNIALLRVLANGQIEVQRTAGSATYNGALLMQWV